MNTMKFHILRMILLSSVSLAFFASENLLRAAETVNPAFVPLLEKSFFYGHNQFLLQSGRTRMFVQAHKVNIAPAFTYLLFDAQRGQNAKRRAFNFAAGQGLVDSALEVLLGKYAFTAQGENTEIRWTTVEGIPAVEAVWWAGGIRATERLFALNDRDAFLRRIILESKDLIGTEKVSLRLSLPPGDAAIRDGLLIQQRGPMTMALGAVGKHAGQTSSGGNTVTIGPIELAVGQAVVIDTLLLAQLPNDGKPRWRPAVVPAAAKNASLAALDIGEAIAETRESWAAVSKISAGDPLLREVYSSACNTLPAVVADDGTVIAGPFQYGDGQWVRDSSNILIGAVHAGHFERARAGLECILKRLIDERGSTLVDGAIQTPDREQFDQMGEFLQALKAYRDFSGDDSLVRQYREKIIAMIERPLKPEFRDAATGMVHNRREYWERTFDDAYELAYQAYVVLGLRCAADLAEPLAAGDRAAAWRAAAEQIWKSTLGDEKFALVEGGKFIKRRNVDGRKFDIFANPHPYQRGMAEEAIENESAHALNPDSTAALPAALGLIDPRSPLSLATLDDLERIRGERWHGDGYMRYASTCELNQIGPWPFATCFVMRAQHDAGLFDRSRRSLAWLREVGPSGAWVEAICAKRSGSNWCGIVVWTTGEIPLFAVRHVLGVRFDGATPALKPAPFPRAGPLKADLRFRKGRLKLEIPGPGPYDYALVDGKRTAADEDGAVRLPPDFTGGTVVFHAVK
ncbi:MAG: hypothetical protein IT426_01050 [Pirellulales bacterium]|nr:hypothetical protein [Pirellulales bacterium]